MGFLSDLFKPRMPAQQWVRFALDQLYSEKWFELRRSFWRRASSQEQAFAAILEQDFLDELLALQLALLEIVAGVVSPEALKHVVLLTEEYLARLDKVASLKVEVARYSYTYNEDIAVCIVMKDSESTGLVDVFVARLGCSPSREFRMQAQRDLMELCGVWEKDAGQYRFS